jgi:hypothetical protein
MSATVQTPAAAERAEAERRVVAELERWRAGVLPDPSAPLDGDDLARLVRSCLYTLGVGEAGADFSVNTVHYYRRKDILDAPAGRTSAARYDVRHVWQAVGARLAGHLGLVTLAEAREVMGGADEPTLIAFAAARILDARARRQLRNTAVTTVAAVAAAPATMSRAERRGIALEAVAPSPPSALSPLRPLPGVTVSPAPAPPSVIPLPGDAYCILPATHAAHASAQAARAVVRALALALGVDGR